MNDKYIECDTERLREDVKYMLERVQTYQDDIEKFFDLLDFTPKDTIAWKGDNANLYSNLVVQDKPDYVKFGKSIEDLIKEIEQFADDLDGTIKENEDTCENGRDEYVSSYYSRR